MRDEKLFFPHDIYLKYLTTVQGIHFTERETDIMTCVFHRRGTSKIASFLAIAPNTVFAHTNNILRKLDCHSREEIIDFIENSGQVYIFKKYYTRLVLKSEFEKTLKIISKKQRKKYPLNVLIYGAEGHLKDALLLHLSHHLSYAGISVEVREQKESDFIDITRAADHGLLLLLEKGSFQIRPQELSNFISVDLSQESHYYLANLEILRAFFPENNLENILHRFLEKYHKESDTCKAFLSCYPIDDQINEKNKKNMEKEEKKKKNYTENRFSIKNIYLFILIILIGFAFIGSQIFKGDKKMDLIPLGKKPLTSSIRSDLAIPIESVLLERPIEMTEMDEKLKGKGIQAIALVGPGGAGKTTLARQFVYKQDVPVIWEMKAESSDNLRYSFENFAQALSQTKEDQTSLRELREINDAREREDALIQFVKEHLTIHGSWCLIYDNVEKFTDIEKFLPQDCETWGMGKVIFTTRNNNIQNSSYLKGTVQIKNLDAEQKLTLFTKIMASDGTQAPLFQGRSKEETEHFLENIPPYPLDITVAAYYLKTANISYETYLENLNRSNQGFLGLQKALLKDGGSYAKTRYSILAASLKQLIQTHEGFIDILLFISLLDSQNIPRQLLDEYQDSVIIDHFIYGLKKYSIMTSESFSLSLGQIFSIHQSTQTIILDYFLDNSQNISEKIQKMAYIMATYADKAIGKECKSQMQILAQHYEAFLTHVRKPFLKNLIRGELGRIYYFLGYYKEGLQLLETSIDGLHGRYSNKDLLKFLICLGKIYVEIDEKDKIRQIIKRIHQIHAKYFSNNDIESAYILTSLGDLYDSLGEHKKARTLLKESIAIERKLSKNFIHLAWSLALLGEVNRQMGNYEEAKDLFEESMTNYKEHVSPDHYRVGWLLVHLGNVYSALGEHKKAKDFLEQGVEFSKRFTPEDHTDVAWALGYLGNAYLQEGDSKRAQETLEKTIAIYRKNFPETHNDLLRYLTYLGKTYIKLDNYKEAKQLLENVTNNYEKIKADPIKIAEVLQALGELSFLENQMEASEDFLKRAIDILEKKKHPDIYLSLEDLSQLYARQSVTARKQGNIEDATKFKNKAIEYLKRATREIRAYFPKDSPHLERVQSKLNVLEQSE